MPGLTWRVVLGAGLLAGAAAVVGWRLRETGQRDLAYKPGARQRLDIWLAQGAGPFPGVGEIPGGDFRSGDKAEVTVAPEVLAVGIVVVRVNHRLSGTDIWPAPAEDCLAAVVFCKGAGGSMTLMPRGWRATHTVC